MREPGGQGGARGGPAWRADAALFDAMAAEGRRTRLALDVYARIYRAMGLEEWLERLAANEPVLEIGCCDGLHLLNLASLGGRPGVGADVSLEALADGARDAAARGLPVRFVAMDALRPALAPGRWRTVLLVNMLHHFASRGLEGPLRAATGLLHPEGRLFVGDLSLLYPYHVLAFGGARVLRHVVPSIRRTFTPGEMALVPGRLKQAARRAGLEPVEGSLGYYAYVEPLSRTAPGPRVFRAAWAVCRALGRLGPRACRFDSFHVAFRRRRTP